VRTQAWPSSVFTRLTRGRVVGWARRLAMMLILVLVATLSDVPARPIRPVQASPTAAPAPKPACPDEVSAAVAAKLCGARVEIAGRRTAAC
jgi:hypothetical protein